MYWLFSFRKNEETTVATKWAESSSDEAETYESDDEAAPLNLSKRHRNESLSKLQESDVEINSDSEAEAPLNLCLRAPLNSPVKNASTASELQKHINTTTFDQEHCDRRHSAAFALCQLAGSSSIDAPDPPFALGVETGSPSGQENSVKFGPDEAKSDQNASLKQKKRGGDESKQKNNKRSRVKELVRDQCVHDSSGP